jgi:hypothetical protein
LPLILARLMTSLSLSLSLSLDSGSINDIHVMPSTLAGVGSADVCSITPRQASAGALQRRERADGNPRRRRDFTSTLPLLVSH